MAKEAAIKTQGTVVEILPGTMFRVRLDNGSPVLCKPSGKMRIHFIHLITGDRVHLEMSPYDTTKGRITFRQK